MKKVNLISPVDKCSTRLTIITEVQYGAKFLRKQTNKRRLGDNFRGRNQLFIFLY